MCIFSFSFRPKLIFIAAKQSDPLVKEKKREAFSLHIILLQYLKKKKITDDKDKTKREIRLWNSPL